MRRALAPLLAAIFAVSACSSSGSSQAPTPGQTLPTVASTSAEPTATDPADWPTYHGRNDRAGHTGAASVRPPLRRAWSRGLDGAVYAQPVVAAGLVVVATENDSVYALRPGSGRLVWRRHLAEPTPLEELPCGNIDPLGITGTPAYDARSGLVFVVTESGDAHHDLHALDVRTGGERWHRNLDVVAGRDRHAEQQRGALLVAHGRVYAAFGGLFGDCGNYVGYVTAVATSGRGDVLRYAVPTGREAGIWAAAGPVEDPATGDVLVAVGNGSQTGGHFDGSDSVLRLSPTLRLRAFFAPSTWPEDNAADLDLGSMSPVVVGDRVVIAGKRGAVYLLAPNLRGVGGELDQVDGCSGFGGAATSGHAVYLPCSDGVRRVDVSGNHLGWAWRASGVAGSPVVVGDVVFSLDLDAGRLVALDSRSGEIRGGIDVGEVTRFATPAVAGRLLLVGTTGGVVAVVGRS